ncbi:MAG: hypothetical protein O3B86_13335, partial [Planctomycetota bacterium]|nr:hypothetical protein [Planctomycetota bacterium]
TLTRPPSEEEVVRLVALYESLSSDLPTGSEVANRLVQAARLETGDAALIAVANVLLNLDEALMKP